MGRDYRLHEDMWPASQGYGNYKAGISPKGRYPKTEGIVILAEVGGGRYGNRWDGETLVYQGEDDRWAKNPRADDQILNRGNNKTLHNHQINGAPVYLFSKSPNETLWTYHGIVEVVKASLASSDRRLVVEFRIQFLGVGSVESLSNAEERLAEAELGDPSSLTNSGTKLSPTLRKVRSASFRNRVKCNYRDHCSICGSLRKDAWGKPEVHAAHIFPKEEDGADDPRNGLSVCSFHHWAFDGGLFFIDEDLRIRLSDPGELVLELRPLDGQRLAVLPKERSNWPHDQFIKARLALPRYAELCRKARSGTNP
ncbi:MAG: HNH endonuclease [Candidatus Thorarchaeota archaeon]